MRLHIDLIGEYNDIQETLRWSFSNNIYFFKNKSDWDEIINHVFGVSLDLSDLFFLENHCHVGPMCIAWVWLLLPLTAAPTRHAL